MKSSAASSGSLPLNKETILEWYINDVLEGREPRNIYLFSKHHHIQEEDFYKHFNSFEGIENHFFGLLFDKTIKTLDKSEEYEGYSAREKLLSFYYTFFGNLTQNRSFVLHILSGSHLSNTKKWKGLHQKITGFIKSIDIKGIDLRNEKIKKVQDRAIEELGWAQFLSVFKFWQHDESPDFEKTDIYIEKSVTAGFELANTKPLKSVVDLGKFLLNEIKLM